MPLSFSERVRRTLERCAIPGLIRYVVLFNALVFVLQQLAAGFVSVLELDPALVLHGEVWRLVTWIFIPATLSPIWIVFALLFLFFIGDGLEAAIGSSRLTLFYVSGMAACTIVSFVFGIAGSGITFAGANIFLNLSLLLAYATVYPEFKVLVLFIIPMRISWLAMISALLMILSCLQEPLVVGTTLGAVFLNYFLYFRSNLRDHLRTLNPGIRLRSAPLPLRKTREAADETLHRCAACGRTEQSHPDLDFRVTASGEEYCREHLPKQA